MPRKPATLQVPGETKLAETTTITPEASSDTTPATENGSVGTPGPVTGGAQSSGETVTVPKADLSALMDRLAALEQRQQSPRSSAVQVQELPDQSEIDPTKITTPQLSKQGWVVPHAYGSHPNQPKL